MSRTAIVVIIDDEHMTSSDVHEAVIVALDLAGFRSWTSYVTQLGDPVAIPPDLR